MHKFIIIGIIGIIVIIQLWIFLETLKKINLFESIFPFANRFSTIKVYIPENSIGKLSYEEISKNISHYSAKPTPDDRRSFTIQIDEKANFYHLSKLDEVLKKYENKDYRILIKKVNRIIFADKSDYDRLIQEGWSLSEHNVDLIEVTLIQNQDQNNVVLDKIINAINTYLLRNKGAVSDFNLVKDVVERNCDAEDEQINTLLPIPLYLGLMGTMLGIIIGVGYMAINGFDSFLDTGLVKKANEVVASNPDSNGIVVLMGAVGVAMISSFIGLLLTTIASGWFYKSAKSHVEGLKNDFYTFIQTELLPSISNSATNSIINLQTNLLKFNDGFTSNVTRFDGLLSQILSSFNNQMSIIQDLKDIDLVKLARINIDVLRELRNSTSEFEKFSQYIHQVNALVSNATELNTTLKSDLADIENRKYTVQQAFTKVNDSFENGLAILKESTDERLKDVKIATGNQQDAFEQYLEHNRILLKEITDNEKEFLAEQFAQNQGILKEIIDNEKGLLVEQLDQNKEVLIELKKQSELRQSLEKVEHAIVLQNKVLNDQNRTLGSFSQSADDLNKSVKKLSTLQQSPNTGPFKLPPFAKYLGYAFAITGVAASITVMIFIGSRFLVANEQPIKSNDVNGLHTIMENPTELKEKPISNDSISIFKDSSAVIIENKAGIKKL